ncbi:Prophage integrase IntS [Brevundimonas sp. NIBR10]|uniref:tyrosine-type recombinase/integrase n=1 Tax=Brevundimonas sp. NIBR10 TaxID=3015997 RepID=UPI0022F1D6C0|nr:site-specific integrase [Brevundimonas sp. NIBR10]WGM48617.1 Prophage integrase IntS [Brevundimonas sp. NIBR10]
MSVAKPALTHKEAVAEKVKAKASPSDRREAWDDKVKGLCLRTSANGTQTWVYRYRFKGRQPRFTIGRGDIGVQEARRRARDVQVRIDKGEDPAGERRRTRADDAAPLRTFNDLADLYERQCASGDWRPMNKTKRQRTLDDEKAILLRHVRPTLGKLGYAEITRQDVKACLRKMTKKGITAQTNRAHAVTRQVFAFAIAEDLVAVNPATGFPLLAEEKPRVRIYRDDELAALWAVLSDPSEVVDATGDPVRVGEAVRIAIKLAMMLGQRRNEIAGMAVAELDLSAKTWLIPGERMKGGRAHMVALPDDALPLIRRALEIANTDVTVPAVYVFPTRLHEDRAILPNSLTRALRKFTEALKIEGATFHDIRRTVSTNLTSERIGVTPFIRSKVLGHQDAGGGAVVSSTVYDSNTYLAEKRRALTAWANLLLEIVGERARPGNVTELRAVS